MSLTDFYNYAILMYTKQPRLIEREKMALPASLALVTVTGTYVSAKGTPVVGAVEFLATSVLTETATNVIVVPTVYRATLDANGHFSISLPSTNDPDLTPVGITYKVSEKWTGGRTFEITVPYNAGTLDMADITPVVAITPTTSYLLVSSRGAANGVASLDANARVPLAQLASGTPDGTRYLKDDGSWSVPPGTGGGGGVTDHGALTGLTDADHPIAAVQGLQDELDSKAVTGHTHTEYSATNHSHAYALTGVVLNPSDTVPADLPIGALVFTRDTALFGFNSKVGSAGFSNLQTVQVPLTGPVNAGQTLIALIVQDGAGDVQHTFSGTVTGNSWQTDASSPVQATTVQAHILSVKLATNLATGTNISITAETTVSRWAVMLYVVDGLAATSWKDKSATNGGNSASPSVTTAATVQANEIAFAVFGANPAVSGVMTIGAGWTDGGQQDSGATARRALGEYKILTATGAVTATCSFAVAANFAAAVATYKKA